MREPCALSRASQRARPSLFSLAGGAVPGQENLNVGIGQARAEHALEGGMDLGEQAAQPVGGAVDLAGQVVVVAGEHGQLGQHLVVAVHRTQGVRHGAGGLGDHERVAGIGLGLARVQVGGPAHRQPGQVGDPAARRAGHRQRQRADVGDLVHDHQNGAELRHQFGEQFQQFRLGVGQPLVVHGSAVLGPAVGVMELFAQVQAEEEVCRGRVDHVRVPLASRLLDSRPSLRHHTPATTLRRHATPDGPALRRTGVVVRPLISGQAVPRSPAATPPRSSLRQGAHSHTGPGGQAPHCGATKKVTGRDCPARSIPHSISGPTGPTRHHASGPGT
ncbi:hypothetical protein SHIRM173S_13339 [Streptomyces hirsutus]